MLVIIPNHKILASPPKSPSQLFNDDVNELLLPEQPRSLNNNKQNSFSNNFSTSKSKSKKPQVHLKWTYIDSIYHLHFYEIRNFVKSVVHFVRKFRKKCTLFRKSVMVDELNINYYYYNYNHKLRHFVLLLLITYCNVC